MRKYFRKNPQPQHKKLIAGAFLLTNKRLALSFWANVLTEQ